MAGLIPPHLLEQIRAANDIVDVIGSYLPLKRAGANFRALCPFHREKTPSFNVNPHHQIFKCFGCGKGGDVFTFVREYEGLEFMDVVRRLAERARIPLEFENNPAAQQQKHIKEVLWNIHEQVTQRWQAALANDAAGEIARDYLAKRGVSSDAIKLFRLGAAPEAWDDTVNWAKSKGHDFAVMEQAGLIIRKEGTDRYYDRFRGRLIFPICDEQGRVIGFSGRILSGDEKVAKYVNSPETPIFTKGKVFFGLDKSKRPLLDSESAIICEGQLDLISCYMAGVQNVVAPQGTALTADHARVLKRYVEEVVLCFDADNAGQTAAIRSLDPLLAAGLAIRVATIPNGKDPDDFIKQNDGEAFREIIGKAEGFFDWYLKRLCATNDTRTDKGRVTVLREFGEALAKTRNAVLIDTHAQRAALRLGVESQAVRKELEKAAHVAPRQEPVQPDAEIPSQTPKILAEEFVILKRLLETDGWIDWIAKHLDPAWILSPSARAIADQTFDLHKNNQPINLSELLSKFENSEIPQLITSVLTGELVRHADGTRYVTKKTDIDPEVELKRAVQSLRDNFIERELQRLRLELTSSDLTQSQLREIERRRDELRAQRKSSFD